jgi:hypothetical protein
MNGQCPEVDSEQEDGMEVNEIGDVAPNLAWTVGVADGDEYGEDDDDL